MEAELSHLPSPTGAHSQGEGPSLGARKLAAGGTLAPTRRATRG